MLENAIQVAPPCSKAEFDSKTWPPGTEWHPLDAEDKKNMKASMESRFVTRYFTHVLDNNEVGRVREQNACGHGMCCLPPWAATTDNACVGEL